MRALQVRAPDPDLSCSPRHLASATTELGRAPAQAGGNAPASSSWFFHHHSRSPQANVSDIWIFRVSGTLSSSRCEDDKPCARAKARREDSRTHVQGTNAASRGLPRLFAAAR